MADGLGRGCQNGNTDLPLFDVLRSCCVIPTFWAAKRVEAAVANPCRTSAGKGYRRPAVAEDNLSAQLQIWGQFAPFTDLDNLLQSSAYNSHSKSFFLLFRTQEVAAIVQAATISAPSVMSSWRRRWQNGGRDGL